MQLRYDTNAASAKPASVDAPAAAISTPSAPSSSSAVPSADIVLPAAAPLPTPIIITPPTIPAIERIEPLVPMDVEDNNTVVEDEPVPPLNESLQRVLAQNFDAVSTPAILTICKYIVNIYFQPNEAKFRSVKRSNKVFQEKIAKCVGAELVLRSIGFSAQGDNFHLPEHPQQKEVLQLVYKELLKTLDELQVPPDQRPELREPVNVPPPVEFDPFKTCVMRTANQVSDVAYCLFCKIY
jgi:hypothetical protein